MDKLFVKAKSYFIPIQNIALIDENDDGTLQIHLLGENGSKSKIKLKGEDASSFRRWLNDNTSFPPSAAPEVVFSYPEE